MADTAVTVTWQGQLRAEARTEDGIRIEASALRNYGEGTAGSPMELLLASLGACSLLATLSVLTRLTPGLRRAAVEVSGRTAEGYPKVFTAIDLRYTFAGDGLTPEIVEKARSRPAGRRRPP